MNLALLPYVMEQQKEQLRREAEERQKEQQLLQRINHLKRTITSKRTEISDLHRTISSHRTDLQQQQSIYNANAGKLFGKKKAQAAQTEINRLNAEISKTEQKKAELEAEIAKLEAELKELEAKN